MFPNHAAEHKKTAVTGLHKYQLRIEFNRTICYNILNIKGESEYFFERQASICRKKYSTRAT